MSLSKFISLRTKDNVRWSKANVGNSEVRLCLHLLSPSPFFVSGTFDLFNVICKQHHRAALNPFLNGTKTVTLTVCVNEP